MAVEYFLVPTIASEHDVRTISAELTTLPGVLLVTVSLIDRRVRVEHTGEVVITEIIHALNQAGYEQVAILA